MTKIPERIEHALQLEGLAAQERGPESKPKLVEQAGRYSRLAAEQATRVEEPLPEAALLPLPKHQLTISMQYVEKSLNQLIALRSGIDVSLSRIKLSLNAVEDSRVLLAKLQIPKFPS